MNELTIKKSILIGMLLALMVAHGGLVMAQMGNLAKIDPDLQERILLSPDANETFRVIIEMAEQYDNPNLERGTTLMTRAQRRQFVVEELKRFSEQSQAEVVNYLTEQSTRGQVNLLHRFWIFNGVCCEATSDCIGELSLRGDVRNIGLDKEINMVEQVEEHATNDRDTPPLGKQWHVEKVRADDVWNMGYTGSGIVVAIIDTGVNYNHVAISDKMWDGGSNYPNHGWDFHDNDNDPMDEDNLRGHGSHVAGIVASEGALYKAGVAPDATIMALKVSDEQGNMNKNSIFQAIEFALEHGADIMNLSLGQVGIGGEADFRDKFVNVLNAGVVATVCAGNDGYRLDEYPTPFNIWSPANCPPPWPNPDQASAVICVGNTTSEDLKAYDSSIGPTTWTEGPYIGNDYLDYSLSEGGLIRPDLAAPGTNIWSIDYEYDHLYRKLSGTSMAAPCVAGVIALMLEANPNLTPAKIDSILETTAVHCENQTGKNNYYGSGRVDAYEAVTAALNLNMPQRYHITTMAFPSEGGTTTGGGYYFSNDSCTVTAIPNPGFVFMGWYNNALGTILYSRQPEYTFAVTRDRHLYAKFILQNYNISTSCSPTNGGTVTGDGSYMAGSTVTLTASANTGYLFSCWTEDGEVVSTQPNYSFQAQSDRHLVANFMNLSFAIGDVITNPDGSQGVVFYINPTYTGGCMVALEDISTTCPWGSTGDIPFLRNYARTKHEERMSDLDGYANTTVVRDYQSANANYASGKVDYEHGWYVPSAGQLRKIYSALPFIESAITNAGGTKLTNNAYYWSSTERSETNAWVIGPALEVLNTSKTSNYRLRAVHDFSINNTMHVQLRANNTELGNVAGTGFYASGSQVTVTATPTGNNLFRGWTESGHLVSQSLSYTFTANANRNLVANFAVRGGVGTLVTNPDGSQGILFHLNEDGTKGLMVALEDASEGCQWGSSSDIAIMRDRSINNQRVLEDQSGYHNTQIIRMAQGTNNSYAASVVDFDNGWYLPSSGELRKLYAVLPMIEEALIKAGGITLTDGKYWSSTEYSASYASTPGFGMAYTAKTSNCRVRAIHNYIPENDHIVLVAANDDDYGTVSVSGSGVFAQNQIVTVTATPKAGYQFDHWREDGAIMSYDATYQFPFTRSRSLVAHFVVPGSVGSVVTNADGSRGVVFYTDPSGNSLMVALEDVSSGCAWGTNQDITTLENLNPGQTQNMLNAMNGYANTQIIRDWQSNNSNYAAGTVDFANDWYLPSAGQLRKLYAALPLIEEAIVCAGGSLMTGNPYWSSSENATNYAWSPSFEFTKTSKTSNLRVRAIRGFESQIIIPNAQTIALSAGTNWFSTYVDITLDDLKASLVAALPNNNATITIKSKAQNVKYQNGRWAGSLTTFDVSQLYKIIIPEACEISLEGMPVDPSTLTVTITPGANWIAFPYSESMSVMDFFGLFPINNDVVKSKFQNTRYNNGRWAGQLNTLVPGQGYIYNSAATGNRTFTFPTTAK